MFFLLILLGKVFEVLKGHELIYGLPSFLQEHIFTEIHDELTPKVRLRGSANKGRYPYESMSRNLFDLLQAQFLVVTNDDVGDSRVTKV